MYWSTAGTDGTPWMLPRPNIDSCPMKVRAKIDRNNWQPEPRQLWRRVAQGPTFVRANHRRNAESTTSHQYVEQRAEDDGTYCRESRRTQRTCDSATVRILYASYKITLLKYKDALKVLQIFKIIDKPLHFELILGNNVDMDFNLLRKCSI